MWREPGSVLGTQELNLALCSSFISGVLQGGHEKDCGHCLLPFSPRACDAESAWVPARAAWRTLASG